MQNLVEQYHQEQNVPALDIAAALAQIAIADSPLSPQKGAESASGRDRKGRDASEVRSGGALEPRKKRSREKPNNSDNEVFRIEVGAEHGVEPSNIVGAIANEAGLGSDQIGRIFIDQNHSTVELPRGMPKEIFRDLKKVWVCGRTLNISRLSEGGRPPRQEPESGKRADTKKKKKKDKEGSKERSKAPKAKNRKSKEKNKGKRKSRDSVG